MRPYSAFAPASASAQPHRGATFEHPAGSGTLCIYPRSEGSKMPVVVGEILGWEILMPVALIAILFGGSKIPQLARSLGRAQNEFKQGLAEGAKDEDTTADQ